MTHRSALELSAPGGAIVLWLAAVVVLNACGGAEVVTPQQQPPGEVAEAPDEPPPPLPEQPGAAGEPEKAAETPAPVAAAEPESSQPEADAVTPADAAGLPESATPEAPKTYIKYENSAADVSIQEGVTYLKEHNYFDARQRFMSATQQDSQSATAWYNLGLIQWRESN